MKRILGTLLLAFSMIACASYIYADEGLTTMTAEPQEVVYYNGWYVEPLLMGFFPWDDELDNGVYFGVRGGYQWNEWLSIEVETGYVNLDLSDTSGDVSAVPLLLGLRWNVLVNSEPVEPYIYGALGPSFNNADGVGQDIDNSLAVSLGGGFEYYLNDSLSIQLDARIYLTSPDWEDRVLGDSDLEIHAFAIGSGVVFRF